MPPLFRLQLTGLLLSLGLLLTGTGCRDRSTEQPLSAAPPTPPAPTATPTAAASPSPSPVATPDFYNQAINRASSAYNISQSARSPDDWSLVASRWQQAIDLMKSVRQGDTFYPLAQEKIGEYQRNLTFAQQQAREVAKSPVVANNPAAIAPVAATRTTNPAPGTSSSPASVPPSDPSNGVYRAQIIRRAGGTPVIEVKFNGSQRFEMIVDTGASGTLITQRMATALGVRPIGNAIVATASQQAVEFPVGYVDSIEVNGATVKDVPVAIAGNELEVGLLGHDFFGDYDVTLSRDYVEFRER
jgi:predicted aspartyl protease